MLPSDEGPQEIFYLKYRYGNESKLIKPDLAHTYAKLIDKWGPLLSQAKSDPKNCLTPGAIRHRRLAMIMLENQVTWLERHKALSLLVDVFEKMREKRGTSSP